MTQNLTQEQLVRAISDMGPHYAAILYGAGDDVGLYDTVLQAKEYRDTFENLVKKP